MKTDFIDKVHAHQANSARSQQVEIGASELGGCRTRVYYQLNGAEKTNPDVKSLSAWMGTAIHKAYEELYADDDSTHNEIEVTSRGMKGHVDIIKGTHINDLKTITKKNKDYLGSKQQWWQQDVYGLMSNDSGIPIETVGLLGVCRDGDESDVIELRKPYDESNALEALAWLEDIKSRTEPPEPEKDALWCKSYCPFFGLCPGRTPVDDIDFLIDDFDINSAARDYLELGNKIKEMEIKRDGAKQILEGARGTTVDGITISWSLVAGRRTIDEQVVLAHMGEVPKKQGEPSMRLVVKA